MIEAETVQPMDVEQPLQDNGQDVQKQVDGETTVGEKDLRGVISSCKSTKLVEVVQEAVDKLENDIIPSSEILSMGEPSTPLPEPKNTDSEKEKNIIMEIESSISLQEVDKETKSILQHTYEETQEFVQEANRETELPIQEANKETELPIPEAKKEVKLPTPEASTEYKLPVQETNEETQMHLEASQMEIKIHAQETDKKSQIPVQEPGEKAQAPIQVEDKECQQDSDKEAQLPIQVAAKESELPQEAEKEKQLFMLEAQASPILRPKDEAPEEVLEFLADTKYTDEYDFYDAGDDYDEDPEYDPETNVQDNNGWSVRTRAVSQFLRATFQALETDSKNLEEAGPLGLERLLLGKNRKEAARMFFETLVLKTKDYLDVQQNKPYDDIKISARAKLLKTDI
ncbi:hypothetical protein O6H91_01G148000 [Diphasiastrum complanatum]|uniref:Uncharacterized protein n=1 Tax=Diphasiastrum complanatum TaxID=34168 RepID=A0ACC2EX74_DIPCM|nr:hypothetical protein O6H91_01G148000 [Diphasiastrum complanatum]